MPSDLPPDDSEIFAAVAAVTGADRGTLLDRLCAGDAARRHRLERLLRAHDAAAASFMAEPADAALTPPAPADPASGDRIGRYKLLQKIGEGGCGTVYMAEQEEPVRRRVALKVIKLGMDTKAVIARFEAERQALALMEHTNIAKVLDAGATETGRPFFVMELVRGIPITRYCDESNLPTAARLRLFTQVCHAVQHAHQKGIIHRDLKPSNILVTLHDGVPVPKVIDFGIAKATQGKLTDQTLFTAFEQFIGTPAYMSPEQAEMSGLDIDTRSDIYSLGVLLYELLTGRPPFDPSTLLNIGLDEIRRIIREVDPPRPSTRLSTLTDADRATIAKQRSTQPAQLSTLLRGDLDWIVMRCLEKVRTRRYETANGLALDVQRHLCDEPVSARPPSTAYRLGKLVRRHKLALTAGTAVLGALVIGFGVATRAYFQEKAAHEFAVRAALEQQQALAAKEKALGNIADVRRSAQASEKKASLESARSRYALRLAQHLLASRATAAPGDSAERTPALRALDRTAQELTADLELGPEIRAEILETLGEAYLGQEDLPAAEKVFRELLALRRKHGGVLHPETQKALNQLLDVLKRQGKSADADRELRLVQRERAGLLETENAAGAALVRLGRELQEQGRFREAEANYWEALRSNRWGEGFGRQLYIGDIARLRFEAGDFVGARRLALEWLADEREARSLGHVLSAANTSRDLTLYHANSLLGRIALQEGDRPTAIRHLLASADLPGASQYYVTRGQLDYTLAVELLRAGERPAALRFLDLIEQFYVTAWISGRQRESSTYLAVATGQKHAAQLAEWRGEIAAGRVPAAWHESLRAPPAFPPAELAPLPPESTTASSANLRWFALRLEHPFLAQLLGWALLIGLLPTRFGVNLLSRRARLTLGAMAAWRTLESLAVFRFFGGNGTNLPPFAARDGILFTAALLLWFFQWEWVRAMRDEQRAGRATLGIRLALGWLAVFFLVGLQLSPGIRNSIAGKVVSGLGAGLTLLLPLLIGLVASRELWRWIRRTVPARFGPRYLLYPAVPLFTLQAFTCLWAIFAVIDPMVPWFGRGLLWATAALPWLLVLGLLAAASRSKDTG